MCAKNSYHTQASLKFLECVGKLTIYVFKEWVMDLVLTIDCVHLEILSSLLIYSELPNLRFVVILLLGAVVTVSPLGGTPSPALS